MTNIRNDMKLLFRAVPGKKKGGPRNATFIFKHWWGGHLIIKNHWWRGDIIKIKHWWWGSSSPFLTFVPQSAFLQKKQPWRRFLARKQAMMTTKRPHFPSQPHASTPTWAVPRNMPPMTDYQSIPHSISPHVPVLLSFKKDTHVPICLYFQEILRNSPGIASEERWISVMYWTIGTTNSFQLLWRQGWLSEVEAGNNIKFCLVRPGPTIYPLHTINCDTFRTLWTFYKTSFWQFIAKTRLSD